MTAMRTSSGVRARPGTRVSPKPKHFRFRGVTVGLWMGLGAASLAGCGRADDADSQAALGSTVPDVATATVNVRGALELLRKDSGYQASRTLTRRHQDDDDTRRANSLGLDAARTAKFLAIMDEHRTARLEVQDALAATIGLGREERLERVRQLVSVRTAEAASVASLNRRIASELGETNLNTYHAVLEKENAK
jgi:hypothetical protein